jgi:hypothetical protein
MRQGWSLRPIAELFVFARHLASSPADVPSGRNDAAAPVWPTSARQPSFNWGLIWINERGRKPFINGNA